MKVFVLLLAASSALFARVGSADVPFELPTSRDPARPGAVMLHGGGLGLRDEIRSEFVRLAGGARARIVLMPSDEMQRGRDDEGKPVAAEDVAAYERRLAERGNYGRWASLASRGEVADFRFAYRDPEHDPGDERLFAALEQATGVWLPAAYQTWLPNLFGAPDSAQTKRFQAALRGVVERGGAVGALGGGAASLSETMIAGSLDTDGGWTRAELGLGIGLLRGTIIDQNFASHSGRLERMTDCLRNGPTFDRRAGKPGVERRTIGLGLERHTAVVLQANTIRAIGAGRAHIFLKSNGDRTITWRALAPQEGAIKLVAAAENRGPASKRERPELSATNPFGMPEPIDRARPGTVVLHGGGSTGEMLDVVPKLAGKAAPRLVHCPAARESCRPTGDRNDPQFVAHLERTFDSWRGLQTSGRLADLSFVTTADRADANREAFVRPITQADGVWFAGGDQQPLAELFVDGKQPTLFQRAVLDVVRRGGVVGGSSAGLAIMSEVMIEGGESADGRPAQATLGRGLGAMTNVLAEQHFDARAGRIERLAGLLRDHARLVKFHPQCKPAHFIALAVEEDTALVAQGHRVRVVGKKLAHVFLQSDEAHTIVWHALHSGDAAVVRPGPSGYVLELDDWTIGE